MRISTECTVTENTADIMQNVNTVCANNAKCKYIEIYVQTMEQLQYLLLKF